MVITVSIVHALIFTYMHSMTDDFDPLTTSPHATTYTALSFRCQSENETIISSNIKIDDFRFEFIHLFIIMLWMLYLIINIFIQFSLMFPMYRWTFTSHHTPIYYDCTYIFIFWKNRQFELYIVKFRFRCLHIFIFR